MLYKCADSNSRNKADMDSKTVIARVLNNAPVDRVFDEWGAIPAIEGRESRTSGTLIHRNENGSSECGVWNCTPGVWECFIVSDEFCYFLSGKCKYTQDSGNIIENIPDTAAFFPKGWKGICAVHETVRKVYMIR